MKHDTSFIRHKFSDHAFPTMTMSEVEALCIDYHEHMLAKSKKPEYTVPDGASNEEIVTATESAGGVVQYPVNNIEEKI